MTTDKHTCKEQISDHDPWHPHLHTCGVGAKFCEQGMWYCGTHRPSKRVERRAKYEAEKAARARDTRHAAASQAVVEAAMAWHLGGRRLPTLKYDANEWGDFLRALEALEKLRRKTP